MPLSETATHRKAGFFFNRLPSQASLALRALGTRVVLAKGDVVFGPSRDLDHVYFLEEGVAGIFAQGGKRRSTGCALIGPEGYLVPAAVLGAERVPNRCQMIISGIGLRVATKTLITLHRRDELLQQMLLKFSYVTICQIIDTSLCQSDNSVLERLSRLILMLHDRSMTDDIYISHADLALILGVRRSSVTEAIHRIEGKRMIVNDRGFLSVSNRSALVEASSHSYGKSEREYNNTISSFF